MIKPIYFIVIVLSAVIFLRIFIYSINVKTFPEGKTVTFETQVLNQPKISPRGQQVNLDLPNSQRVIVRLSLKPLINYGDKVRIQGSIEYFEAKNGNKVAFMNYPDLVIVKRESATNLIYIVRKNIISFFNSYLSPSQSSLMLGIVFGIKQEMPNGFYDNLKKTGLLHVIAASGMNITMVGGYFASFFSFFLRRQIALIFSILGILFYALLAGLEPSIVRASVMGILVFGAQIIGRQSLSFLSLFLAGFFMLIINPSLIFDIGFQLSFMATFGLICFSPLFYLSSKLKSLIKKSIIGTDFITTITAQIFTLPILLINFGSYSIISVIVNGLLLWTVPILMIIGGLSSIFSFVFEPLGNLILYLSLPLLIYFEAIVNLFGSRSNLLSVNNLPLTVSVGYYLMLFAIIIFVQKRK